MFIESRNLFPQLRNKSRRDEKDPPPTEHTEIHTKVYNAFPIAFVSVITLVNVS